MQVSVRDNNVDQALRALKKKLQREGVFREMKLKQHFEKPSEKKAREKAEAIRRARKLARKKAQREGMLKDHRHATIIGTRQPPGVCCGGFSFSILLNDAFLLPNNRLAATVKISKFWARKVHPPESAVHSRR